MSSHSIAGSRGSGPGSAALRLLYDFYSRAGPHAAGARVHQALSMPRNLCTPPAALTPMSGPTTRRISATSATVAPSRSEAGGRLHVVGAGGLGQRACRHFLLVGEQRRLDNHLAEHAGNRGTPTTTAAMSRSTSPRSPDFERADVDHHVDFGGAIEDRRAAFRSALTSVVVAPSGNPTTVQTPTALPRSSARRGATQVGFTQTVANPNSRRLAAQLLDILPRGVGLQQRVVDQRPPHSSARVRPHAVPAAWRRRPARRGHGSGQQS